MNLIANTYPLAQHKKNQQKNRKKLSELIVTVSIDCTHKGMERYQFSAKARRSGLGLGL